MKLLGGDTQVREVIILFPPGFEFQIVSEWVREGKEYVHSNFENRPLLEPKCLPEQGCSCRLQIAESVLLIEVVIVISINRG